MSTFLSHYLAIGVGMYAGMCLKDPSGFVKADAASLLRGLIIGIPFWPIGVIIQLIWILK
jgi:hypothetical protein